MDFCDTLFSKAKVSQVLAEIPCIISQHVKIIISHSVVEIHRWTLTCVNPLAAGIAEEVVARANRFIHIQVVAERLVIRHNQIYSLYTMSAQRPESIGVVSLSSF